MSTLRIALVGTPNSGKTALFNQMTGSRQKVANYSGVTIERKEGRVITASGHVLEILDLPGTYSFEAASPDEEITRDVCYGLLPGEPLPDRIICVADATNLRLHLRFVLEVCRLGRPMVLALNMMDAARRRGIVIDTEKLSRRLGIPVVETVAVQRGGARALLALLDKGFDTNGYDTKRYDTSPTNTRSLSKAETDTDIGAAGTDLHAQVNALLADTVLMPTRTATIDDALDRWALHPIFGLALLTAVMFLIFQAVFSWATPFQDGIESIFAALSVWVSGVMPPGPLRGLLVEGVIAGLGGVVVFLPQILILFLFILALEESGYLPRAAFLLDRIMFSAGLSGRSFIPLLSSYACAIPGIMATRSIQDPRDRLATILVAPLTTCSARLPVYALLIGAFIPRQQVMGIFNLQGLVLFALYLVGIISVLVVAYAMKQFRRDKSEHALLMELPSYRMPHARDLIIGLYERALIFLKRVGGIIFTLTVLLWFLLNFPAPPVNAVLPAIDYSFAGQIGHALEYIFAPIGFNWQICVALIPGLAAREVAVSSLSTVYAISGSEQVAAQQLSVVIASQWSLATAMSLLAWYVFAPQCLSTLAVIRRETGSWRYVGLAAGYLFGLAYLASFVTYRIASALT